MRWVGVTLYRGEADDYGDAFAVVFGAFLDASTDVDDFYVAEVGWAADENMLVPSKYGAAGGALGDAELSGDLGDGEASYD